MPLAAYDPAAFRAAEAALWHNGRVKTGLANLGPGAMAFAEMMDGTASFLISKLPARMKTAGTAGGRVAAPLQGVPTPGDIIVGTFAMTTVAFIGLIESRSSAARNVESFSKEQCPCSIERTFDPTKDEVTVEGNKGTIFTTFSAKVTVSGSKLSMDLKLKVEGEVRDAKTGALLYKISNEATGHADGDSCPDTSGVVTATFTFGGHEDYFDATGAKTASDAFDDFGGQLRVKADDNAKLAGVEIHPAGDKSGFMLELAARGTAPAFEKAWRSGLCIEVVVDPRFKDVEAGSVTTITARVRQKFERNDLDKPVEAKLTSGVKAIEPAGQKQKAPATFRYTAGGESGDFGTVDFESASNRGLGSTNAGYTVAGGWTISGPGESHENVQDIATGELTITISDLKITADKDGALRGRGTMRLTGEITSGGGICRADLDQTAPITATGTLVGEAATGVLKLALQTPAQPGVKMTVLCQVGDGPVVSTQLGGEGYADRYGQALGTFELPASGGTKAVSRTEAIGGVVSVVASATLTVVKAKK
ncbi:MAG: hypothetical protein M3R54_09040 [Chloroflexota bacterium]|nr:hypothetical protein [Chloroflexota bacterium]